MDLVGEDRKPSIPISDNLLQHFMANPPPPLPQISGTLALTVYTHSSVQFVSRPDDEINRERLAAIGAASFDLAAATAFFYKKPPLSAADIKVMYSVLFDDRFAEHYSIDRARDSILR
jgi:hypothetical protein